MTRQQLCSLGGQVAHGLGTRVEYSTGWLKEAREGRIAVVKKVI